MTEYKSTDPAQSHILPEDQTAIYRSNAASPPQRFSHDQRKIRQ